MKKIILALLCVTILFAATFQVFAENNATLKLKSTKTTIAKDDVIEITVSSTTQAKPSSVALSVDYDNSIFSVLSGSSDWKWVIDGALSSFDTSTNKAVIVPSNSLNGDIFKFKVKCLKTSKDMKLKVSLFLDGSKQASASDTLSFSFVCSHNYSDWEKLNDTQHQRVCSVCDAVDKQNHKFALESEVAPTCKDNGVKNYVCSVCGAKKSETVQKTGKHTFTNYVETKAASCTEKGTKTAKCEHCEATNTIDIAPLGHIFKNDDKVITKAPTCTEKGIEKGICERCKKETTNSIPATGHKFGAWNVVKDSDCVNTGSRERECSVCHTIEKQTIPLKEHEFLEPKTVAEPTIYSKGIIEGVCKNCGASTKQELDCIYEDEDTGIVVRPDVGIFDEGSEFDAALINSDSEKYGAIKTALEKTSTKFMAYLLSASLNGAPFTPHGDFSIYFPITDGYSQNLAIYKVNEQDGVLTKVASEISEDNMLCASISETGDYVVCDLSAVPEDEPQDQPIDDPGYDTSSNKTIIIISIVSGVILLTAAIIVFKKFR